MRLILIAAALALHLVARADPPTIVTIQLRTPTLADQYQPHDFSNLLGMPGFSDKALNTHFTLYQGYVKNTNLLLGLLRQYAQEGKETMPQYAELKRRFGWEFDGMRLHEFYFESLGGKGTSLATDDSLYRQIEKDFGSFEAWKNDFKATGLIRGVGWVILYFDPVKGRLINDWVGEHNIGHLAGAAPILPMDVWEHAYMIDYDLDREGYIKAFFDNTNWDIVSKRFARETRSE